MTNGRLVWYWCYCLLWLISDLVLAEEVEKCFLYPVEAGTTSPKFPLNPSGDTIITINNIYNNNSWFYVTTDEGDPVAQVLLADITPPWDISPLFHCNKASPGELLTVVVRRGEGKQTVQVWDCTNEQDLLVNLTDNTLQVTTNEYINVAYDCPNRCFKFNSGTIHKSFTSGRDGSLIFYGRATDLRTANWSLNILRGDHNWNKNKYMSNIGIDSNCWIIFQVDPQYNFNKNNKLTLNVTIKYKTVSSCSSQLINVTKSKYVGNVPDKDLYINFKMSENVSWATRLCHPWQETNMVTSGEEQPHLTISSTPSTTTDNCSSCTVSAYGECELMWWVVALGVAYVLMLVFITIGLTATVYYKNGRLFSASDKCHTANVIYDDVAEHNEEHNEHTYEEIHINAL
ncbi:uncharacterized protein [Cherax quadricarinatus]|uniref:uncharacterized protein isoform X2 n=1 Tax=Cherax quadricarinatus TaxID=27406 RepID=UPI00387E50B3